MGANISKDREAVVKAREDVVSLGNRLVEVINADRLFQDDICQRLEYTYADKLRGFNDVLLDGIRTSIGLKVPDEKISNMTKDDNCKAIVRFFSDKIDILGQTHAEMKFCERIEEEIFRGIDFREICREIKPNEELGEAKCCKDGTWSSSDNTCQYGFERKSSKKEALTELRTFNRNMVKSFKNIRLRVNDVINSETYLQLTKAENNLQQLLIKTRDMCLRKWEKMNRYQDANSIWQPKDFFHLRQYDRIVREEDNFPRGIVVEILKLEGNEALVRIPGACEDPAKCIGSVNINSLSKAEEYRKAGQKALDFSTTSKLPQRSQNVPLVSKKAPPIPKRPLKVLEEEISEEISEEEKEQLKGVLGELLDENEFEEVEELEFNL